MPISFTNKFNVDKDAFKETGAFDAILDVDSRFFIDPALLKICTVLEFINAKSKVEKYFSDIITLLSHSNCTSDMYSKRADSLIKFKEIKGTCLGYSEWGTDGNAIGPQLRKAILATIKELISAGETDPVLFELLGVFQERVGCDRISDLLTHILKEEIFVYSQRVATELGLPTKTIQLNSKDYNLCVFDDNQRAILLLPSSILSPLPVANGFDDINMVCMENERIRQEINAYLDLGNRKKVSKTEIHKLMQHSKTFREALLDAYKNIQVAPYDFQRDPAGEYIWYEVTKQYVAENPLTIAITQSPTIKDVFNVAMKICTRFKHLIENNGLWELLYNEKNEPKNERAAQLLFFGVADAYCNANDIDFSREINNGRGFVDFKLSKGASQKVLIETKLTSNPQLIHGVETQIPIYMTQEQTEKAIYLIIDNGHEKRFESFIKFYNTMPSQAKDKIPYLLIDGTAQESASKA